MSPNAVLLGIGIEESLPTLAPRCGRTSPTRGMQLRRLFDREFGVGLVTPSLSIWTSVRCVGVLILSPQVLLRKPKMILEKAHFVSFFSGTPILCHYFVIHSISRSHCVSSLNTRSHCVSSRNCVITFPHHFRE
jgi:hypothetical protein